MDSHLLYIHRVCRSPLHRPSTDLKPAEGTGTGSWAAAYAKAKNFVAQLTPEEKVNLTAGTDANNGCSGNIAAIPRLHFPGLCVSDAGNGLVSAHRQQQQEMTNVSRGEPTT
jgi:hypothetical protein